MAQPDKVLFEDVAVTVSTGDRVAVVGVNGSGKTTLLKIMTGVLEPDEGEVRFGRGVRIASLEQDPVLPPGTVREFLGESWEVAAVATKLGVQPLLDRRTDELSGGQAKRVALARVLADDEHGDHDMVVLDEPTNHLDLEAIEWLESRLVKMKSALVLVTHDRHALDRLTTAVGPSKVVELDGGRCFVHQAAAGSSAYATYLDARAERIDREVAGGVDPQDPRPQGTGVVASRCSGPLDQAQGTLAYGERDRVRRSGARRRAGERAAARWRNRSTGQPGRRTGGRRPTLQRRHARRADGVRACRPADRARRSARGRRPERFRQVDAARHHRRPSRAGRRNGQARQDGGRRIRRPALVRSRFRMPSSASWSPGRIASPTSATGRCSSGSGSTRLRSTRRCGCCPVASGDACSW